MLKATTFNVRGLTAQKAPLVGLLVAYAELFCLTETWGSISHSLQGYASTPVTHYDSSYRPRGVGSFVILAKNHSAFTTATQRQIATADFQIVSGTLKEI
eukprot:IDg1591t1